MQALDTPLGGSGIGVVGWGGLLCLGKALDADVFPAEVCWGTLKHASVKVDSGQGGEWVVPHNLQRPFGFVAAREQVDEELLSSFEEGHDEDTIETIKLDTIEEVSLSFWAKDEGRRTKGEGRR